LVDAGQEDNMYRFLRWRFNLRGNEEVIRLAAAVITHPDQDHYRGRAKVFDCPRFTFDTDNHNGIVARVGDDPLGSTARDGKRSYLIELVQDRLALEALLADPAVVGRKPYPLMLKSALESGRVGDVRMISAL